MVRRFRGCGAGLALLAFARAWALPEGFVVERVAGDLGFPVSIAFAPDGRVFFADLYAGTVRIVQDGALLPEPFYTIPDASPGGGPPEDRGALGVALDPAFSENGYVYVYYTGEDPDMVVTNRLLRLRETAPGVGAEPMFLLGGLRAGNGHNAGAIRFAADGTLLVAAGDFSCCRPPIALDPPPAPLDLGVLEGKILRLDRDGGVPADNPFVGVPGARPEIFAYGHRNPFKLAPDRIGPGPLRVYVSENGEDAADEINVVRAGTNSGWPATEGFVCAEGNVCPEDFVFEPPIFIWEPPVSPTGIERYDGDAFPRAYHGDLFVGRGNSGPGYIERVFLNGDGDAAEGSEIFLTVSDLNVIVVDLLQGPDDALYFTGASFGPKAPPPALYRVDATPAALLGWIVNDESDAPMRAAFSRLRRRAGL